MPRACAWPKLGRPPAAHLPPSQRRKTGLSHPLPRFWSAYCSAARHSLCIARKASSLGHDGTCCQRPRHLSQHGPPCPPLQPALRLPAPLRGDLNNIDLMGKSKRQQMCILDLHGGKRTWPRVGLGACGRAVHHPPAPWPSLRLTIPLSALVPTTGPYHTSPLITPLWSKASITLFGIVVTHLVLCQLFVTTSRF